MRCSLLELELRRRDEWANTADRVHFYDRGGVFISCLEREIREITIDGERRYVVRQKNLAGPRLDLKTRL